MTTRKKSTISAGVVALLLILAAFVSPSAAQPDFTVDKICPPVSKVGDEVCYLVIITNTGDTPLEIIIVEDSLVGPLFGCVGVILEPGEDCIDECCFVVPPDAPDPLENTVTVIAGVVGLPNIIELSASCETDLVESEPSISIEKVVDPCEACPGETVIYIICIENTGDCSLENVEVHDPLLCPIYGCPIPEFPTELTPGETACAVFPYVVPDDVPNCPETLENCAEVTAKALDLPILIDVNDCAEICCSPPPPPGGEGCVPGFWMNNGDKHGASAWCERFSPSDPISMHFALNESLVIRGKGRSTITNPTLLQALNANGGGVNAMIRHGIAAMLNACSDCVQYEYSSEDQVISTIEDALNGVGAYTVGELHSMFASYNEAGCPVNQHGECVGVEDEF